MWRAAGDCLPTADWLVRRGISHDPACGLCSGGEETLHHMAWGCPRAQLIWADCSIRGALTGLPQSTGAALQFTDQLFRFIGLSGARQGNGPWVAAILATTMYYIWLNRNFAKHNNLAGRPASFIRTILLEAHLSFNRHSSPSSLSSGNLRRSSDLLVASFWIPPPTGWILVNCDAAVGDSVAGLGMIVRDCMGNPLLAAGKRRLSHSVDMMETHAILLALDLMREIIPQYRAVEIQSDSILALQEVRDMIAHPPVTGVFAQAFQYASGLEALRFTQVRRDGNAPADWIAREACRREFIWVLGDPIPKPLLKLMLSDFTFDPP